MPFLRSCPPEKQLVFQTKVKTSQQLFDKWICPPWKSKKVPLLVRLKKVKIVWHTLQLWHSFPTLTYIYNFDIPLEVWCSFTSLTYLHYFDIPPLVWHTFTSLTYLHQCNIPYQNVKYPKIDITSKLWHSLKTVTNPQTFDIP